MNISIEDAIDLHKCIRYIEDEKNYKLYLLSCEYGVIKVEFNKYGQEIKIRNVFINDHESLKAKEKLQEYFDE